MRALLLLLSIHFLYCATQASIAFKIVEIRWFDYKCYFWLSSFTNTTSFHMSFVLRLSTSNKCFLFLYLYSVVYILRTDNGDDFAGRDITCRTAL